MYTINSLWGIFDLECSLFGAVPESAEQMFEKDSHGHSELRSTRQGLQLEEPIIPVDAEIISEDVYNFETGEFESI